MRRNSRLCKLLRLNVKQLREHLAIIRLHWDYYIKSMCMISFCLNSMIPSGGPNPLDCQITEAHGMSSRGPGLMPETSRSCSEELKVIFRAVHVVTVHVRWWKKNKKNNPKHNKKPEIPPVVLHHAVNAVPFILASRRFSANFKLQDRRRWHRLGLFVLNYSSCCLLSD